MQLRLLKIFLIKIYFLYQTEIWEAMLRSNVQIRILYLIMAAAQDMVLKAKELHPEARFAAHPECTEDVLAFADYVGSTSGIIDYVVDTDADEYIIGTVDGVFNEIRKKAPDKKLYTVKPDQVCVNMKKVTLDKVLDVLENDTNEVFVDEELAQCALKPLNKMLELAAK